MIKLKDLLTEGKLSEDYKKREWEVYVADDPYGKNQKVVKVAKSKRAAVILYNKLIKTDKYFEVGMRVKGFNEEKLSEMNEPWFEITYKDSRGRKKTDSMRAKNPKEAKKDFVNLMKGRGFKVLKVVKEGKLSEKKFIPTVTIEKYGKEISVKKFKTEKEAETYIKQMNKKHQLKRKKGFWGNPKTGVELFRNF